VHGTSWFLACRLSRTSAVICAEDYTCGLPEADYAHSTAEIDQQAKAVEPGLIFGTTKLHYASLQFVHAPMAVTVNFFLLL